MSRTRAIAPLFALGISLARRGIMPVVALALASMTVIAFAWMAFMLASRSAQAPMHTVPLLASSSLAWGSGFLLAFAATAQALRRDRTDGIRDLVALRTTSLTGYLVARVGGLAALLAAIVGGGTLLSGAIAALAATRVGAVPRTLQATLASVVFALVFAVVIAPIAFAALGVRSRIGGYFYLLAIIVFPEIVSAALANVLPETITEVIAIPSALAALRSSLVPGSFDAVRAIRALVALALFAAIAIFVVRRDTLLLERAEDP